LQQKIMKGFNIIDFKKNKRTVSENSINFIKLCLTLDEQKRASWQEIFAYYDENLAKF